MQVEYNLHGVNWIDHNGFRVTSFSGVKVFAKTTYKAISCTCKVMRRDVKEHTHKTTHQQASQYTDIRVVYGWLRERSQQEKLGMQVY